MELEQEKQQQNRNLQAATEYLEKYGHGHGSKIEIENDKNNCTWGEDRTPSPREGKNSESLRGRQNKYQSYCYECQKNGACMRKECRFVHFDPERAYPARTGRHNNQKNYRDNQTPRSRPCPRHKTNNLNRNTRSSNHNGQKPSQRYNNYIVCYNFQNTGSCPYDNRCKFRHMQQYKHNVTNTNSMNVSNDQMYYFRRNADPGGLCQDHSGIPSPCGYCGLYRVSITDTAAIPTCSSRTNSFSRSYRNVAQGEKVTKACVTPSGIHKITYKGSTTLPLCK